MLHLLPDYIADLLQIILNFPFLLNSYHKPLYYNLSTVKKFIPTVSEREKFMNARNFSVTAKQGSLLSICLRHPAQSPTNFTKGRKTNNYEKELQMTQEVDANFVTVPLKAPATRPSHQQHFFHPCSVP